MAKSTTEYIGDVCVDSGQIIITDPCYLIHINTKALAEKFYKDVCDIDDRRRKLSAGPFFVSGFATAIKSESGLGDGTYPVYAEVINDKDLGRRIKKLTIKFFD